MAHRVLLVEDDPFAQELVTAILLSARIEIDVAPDGFVALQKMQTQSYAIALLDYHLPEMDGYALAKLLSESAKQRGSSFRLVGLTADRNGLAARRGSDALFSAILVKPFDPQKLIDLVSTALVEDTSIQQRAHEAAAALLLNPEADRARMAAMTFWRARGIEKLPKACVFPEPMPDQLINLALCFEIVDAQRAEMIIIQNINALAQLMQLRKQLGAEIPPVITLDRALLPVADVVFNVADRESWSAVAERFHAFHKSHYSLEAIDEQPASTELAMHHDRDVLLKTTSLFGKERTDLLLAEFAQNLSRAFVSEDGSAGQRELLVEQLRFTVSAAGTLGFTRLAETCRDLEAAIQQGQELMKPLGKVRAAKLRSLRTLSQLRDFGWAAA